LLLDDISSPLRLVSLQEELDVSSPVAIRFARPTHRTMEPSETGAHTGLATYVDLYEIEGPRARSLRLPFRPQVEKRAVVRRFAPAAQFQVLCRGLRSLGVIIQCAEKIWYGP